MWIWLVIAAVFLFLVGRVAHENSLTTRSRPAAMAATVAHGLALALLGCGTFGMLMAIFLGLLPPAGPHLTGSSLRDVMLWSVGFLALGAALLFGSGGIRRLGGQGAPVARPSRGH
jgi:protein-S-isoprenylcysteine O-methyltransferase Ste14